MFNNSLGGSDMKLGKKLLAICLVLIATIALSICAPAVASAKTYTKGSVTAKVLNVRSGPSKTYKKVGSLKKGASVSIVSTKSGWKKVTYKSLTGYVYGKYIKVK
jgi:uncharacterized protein YraI